MCRRQDNLRNSCSHSDNIFFQGRTFIFQQNNEKSHDASITTAWLQSTPFINWGGPDPATIMWELGYRSPVCRGSNTDKQPFVLTFTTTGILESPVNLILLTSY